MKRREFLAAVGAVAVGAKAMGRVLPEPATEWVTLTASWDLTPPENFEWSEDDFSNTLFDFSDSDHDLVKRIALNADVRMMGKLLPFPD